MFRKILVANDGSKGGQAALAAALDLAKRLDIGLAMICVEEAPRFPASIDEVTEAMADAEGVFDKVIAAAKALAVGRGVAFETHVVVGHPVSSIVDFIQHDGYDLLVVGYMGHSALYNRIIGSTTDRLVELAPCKVLVVK
ncbi:MAG: universal stress protein [Roseiarcus sp.]|jgi:nucleotide-binding universal stress UspA family protein